MCYPPPKLSCSVQRFIYCFTVSTLTLLATRIHIDTVKLHLISHIPCQRLYFEQGVLSECIKSNESQVPMHLWSNRFVIWWFTEIRSKLTNSEISLLCMNFLLSSCDAFTYITFPSVAYSLALFLAFHHGIWKSFITTESGNFLIFKENKK